MIKVMTIFGTRPEAIKLAPIILRAKRHENEIDLRVCVTGQHREMLDQVLELFEITPDVDLNLMRPNQTLADISARTLAAVSGVLEEHRPDWVLVQGDTTTVWSAAMAAFFQGIAVGHVEAGLRTADKRQPFPEELNRRIATQVSDLHFAPTEWAKNNLLREGVPADDVRVTGNTIIDALEWVLAKNETAPSGDVAAISDWVQRHCGDRPVVLITGHRRESFGEGLGNICEAIHELAQRHPNIHWVYPVHLNPNVQQPVRRILDHQPNVHLLDPQPYAAFAYLMKRCAFILTDSGGVQEEAPSLGKPVLVMRDKTERPEGVEAGVSTLVGTQRDRIIQHCERILAAGPSGLPQTSPFGDGHAAERILDALLRFHVESVSS